MKILVVYDSKTGNTETMAKAISEGAERAGAQSEVKSVETVKSQDFLDSDGVIMGSPTYFGQMSSRLKHIIDDSVTVHTRLSGKVGAEFTSSGGTASGAETTLLSIVQAMLVHGMIVLGNAEGSHYGLAVVGKPDNKDLEKCQDLGAQVALLVQRIKFPAR